MNRMSNFALIKIESKSFKALKYNFHSFLEYTGSNQLMGYYHYYRQSCIIT